MPARSLLLSAARSASAASVPSATNDYKDVIADLTEPLSRLPSPRIVPKYDFNWQLTCYPKEPILLSKSTRIECTAHFDHSPNNPPNPDATHEVKWADQSWQEMMIGWFDVGFEIGQKPAGTFAKKKANTSGD